MDPPIPNRGEFDVPCTTEAGTRRQATFQDAPALFPIISPGGVAGADNTVTLTKTYGIIKDDETGETDYMIRRYGVYWILPTLDDNMLQPQPDFHQAGKP